MKVQASRKQPSRSDFATEREFQAAWHKWRQSRDNNNNSVRRSRQLLRSEQGRQEQMCLERARENELLELEMSSLSSDAKLLAKAMSQPLTLSRDERDRVRLMMLEEQAKELGEAVDCVRSSDLGASYDA